MPDSSIHTRLSLLSRLRDMDDHASWRAFFDRYWLLLYNVARRSGLDEAAAQDVVQETVIAVARKMPGFCYDPERGTFKQWLLRIARRRITDHLRKLYRQPAKADVDLETLENDLALEASLGAPASDALDRAWEEEWERSTFEAAVARVRAEANPKHFQVFDYCVLQGWPASKVAATLGLTAAHVYLAKHRVALAVKRAVRRITKEH